MTLVAKSRAVIINEWKLFLIFDLRAQKYMLPWWTQEQNETMKECLEREITEELWIKPIIKDILSIREYYSYWWKISIEYCYLIKNNTDYLNIDKSKCTHSYEWSEYGFYDLNNLPKDEINPPNLQEILNNFLNWNSKKVNFLEL